MPEFRPIEPNPYIVGNPIRDRSMFFGREEDLRFLRDRVDTQGRETVVLCGGRRSGKTSILLQVLDGRLGDRFLPVLVDMQQLAELRCDADLWNVVARRVIERMAGVGLPTDGLEEPSRDVTDPGAAFRRFLEAATARLGKRKLVILVDEYELIEEHVHAGVLTSEVTLFMASLMDSILPISFIFTGSRRIQERDPAVWSRLMSKALHRRISFLALADAERLVREPVRGLVEYEDGAVRAILRLTAGQPFYTQVLCQALVDRLNERRSPECTTADVDAVAEGIADNPLPQMVYWWKSMTLLERVVAALVASAAEDPASFVAAGDVEEDLEAHRKEYGFRTRRASIRGALEQMVEREDLEPGARRDSYRFRMDLARRWIRVEHPVWEVIRDLGAAGTDHGGIRPSRADSGRRWVLAAVGLAVVGAAAVALSMTGRGDAVRPAPGSSDAARAGVDATIASADAQPVPGESLAADSGEAAPAAVPTTVRFARYFTPRFQIPEPLGEYAANDLAGRTSYFAFTYEGDRLARFEHLNGSGRPTPLDWEDSDWWETATTLVPSYRADGTIERALVRRCAVPGDKCVDLAVFVYSADLRTKRVVLPGREVPTWNEDGISLFEYDLDETGRATTIRYRNVLGKPQPDGQGRVAIHAVYDAGGWMTEQREEILGGTGDDDERLESGAKATRVLRLTLDERHNPIRIAMFDGEERPIRYPEGSAWEGVHRIETEFDERDRPTVFRFFGPSGDPARLQGAFMMRMDHDDRGNRAKRTLLGLDGKPAPGDQGLVYEVLEYDDRGFPVLERTLGRDGLQVELAQRMVWDDAGNMVAYSFLDETLRGDDGNPLVVRSRESVFDALGRRILLRVLDAAGKPVAPEGYSVVRYEYDEHGLLLRKWYEGLDGEPAAPKSGEFRGVSSVLTEYDAWGFPVAVRYRDAEGRPVDNPREVADVEWKLDPAGRPLSERSTGASGAPAPSMEWPDSLTRKFTYDADGNVVEQRAFGADGKPVPAATGEFVVRRAYDHLGRMVEELLLDETGAATLGGPYHVARMTKTYAPLGPAGACWTDSTGAVRCADLPAAPGGPARGTVIETRFFDPDGQPTWSSVHGRGIAWVVAVTDAEDRLVELRYFDANDRPTANREGVHLIRTVWSDSGRIEEATFGVDGLPTQPSGPAGHGFARRTWAWDDLGHEVDYRTFGSDGSPRADSHGIAARVRRYEAEWIVEEMFLDAAGAPHVDGEGVARVVWEYDGEGRVTREAFFDADVAPASPPEWTADVRVRYDAVGRAARFDLTPPLPLGAGGPRASGVEIRYEGATAIATPLDSSGERMAVGGVAALRYPKAEWGEPAGCVGAGGIPQRCAGGMETLLRFLMVPRSVSCPTGAPGPGDERCSWM